MSKNSNTIAAIIAGAAVGAAIGILLAPDKGSNTRAKLKEGLDDATGNLKDSLGATSDDISKKFTSATQNLDGTFDNLLSNVSQKADEVISFLEITTAASSVTTAACAFFAGFSDRNIDRSAVYRSAIQFLDCFFCSHNLCGAIICNCGTYHFGALHDYGSFLPWLCHLFFYGKTNH